MVVQTTLVCIFVAGQTDQIFNNLCFFNIAPVTSAIERCKEVMPNSTVAIDVVLAFGDTEFPHFLDYNTTPFVLFRTGFMVVNNIFVKDIQNAKIAYPDAMIRVVKPTKFLPSIGLFFDNKALNEMVDMGYKDAMAQITKHKL